MRIRWNLPQDEGGDPVIGYNLYLNDNLVSSEASTANQFTFRDLTVGVSYRFKVTAVNDIGESEAAELTKLAASVPQKLLQPTLVASTSTSI